MTKIQVTPSKVCFKCYLCKPLTSFYKHPRMKDGHVNKCKECNKKDVRVNYRDNHEYYLEYDRERGKDPARIVLKQEYNENFKTKFPGRKRVNTAVGNAVRDGRMLKPSFCHYCGDFSKKIQAHHSSYAEDMIYVVTWLCTACHGLVHSPSLYETKE